MFPDANPEVSHLRTVYTYKPADGEPSVSSSYRLHVQSSGCRAVNETAVSYSECGVRVRPGKLRRESCDGNLDCGPQSKLRPGRTMPFASPWRRRGPSRHAVLCTARGFSARCFHSKVRCGGQRQARRQRVRRSRGSSWRSSLCSRWTRSFLTVWRARPAGGRSISATRRTEARSRRPPPNRRRPCLLVRCGRSKRSSASCFLPLRGACRVVGAAARTKRSEASGRLS